METAIKIAAESVYTLRKCDVYRVLDQNPSSIRMDIAEFIKRNRPELSEEVEECMEEF